MCSRGLLRERHDGGLGLPAPEQWHVEVLHSTDEIAPAVDRLVADLPGRGFSARDVFAVRLALEEALVNAVKHGNQADPSRAVWLRSHRDNGCLCLQVEDEGPGFNPDDVPNPLDPENLERPTGRGLFLMRTYMDCVVYSERGNRVTMCRQRTAPVAALSV